MRKENVVYSSTSQKGMCNKVKGKRKLHKYVQNASNLLKDNQKAQYLHKIRQIITIYMVYIDIKLEFTLRLIQVQRELIKYN